MKSKGIQSDHHNPEEARTLAEAIIRGTLEGKTTDKIAEETGVEPHTISRLKRTATWEMYQRPIGNTILEWVSLIRANGNLEAATGYLIQYWKALMPREFKGTVTHQVAKDVDAEVLEKYGPLLREIAKGKPLAESVTP